jgi:ribulose-phosphate 3-epimerase
VVRICPSVLNADQSNLADEIQRVGSEADFIHLDIMDNRFVPNFTYDAERTLEIVRSSVLPIDLHLMVEDADYWGPHYAGMANDGVFSVTVHYEAIKDLGGTLKAMGERGVRRGVALKPATPVEVVKDYLNEIEMILIMTVEPGFGGQSFMREMMPKVRQSRMMLEEMGREITWLQVDGGISLSTIEEAAEAGADTFVAGSAVYRSGDPAEMVHELRTRAAGLSQ